MSTVTGQLSIREIARRTGVPESTLRYYRSLFPDHIPTIGAGRNRRHPEEAVNVFQLIAGMFANGESRGTVRRQLEGGPADYEPQAIRRGGEPNDGVARRYEIAVAHPQLPSREIEDLLTALLLRDRELAAMHRELLEMVGQLLHALGRLAGARPGLWADRPEVAIPPPPRPAEPAESREPAEPESPVDDRLEVERLRETLTRERETVERLRHARLELERRLAKLEREKKR
ncbi:MAG TPA: MerR family transcriptional regulator [Gemmatimonadota bacterium]|nr:MerR family transcriptional regulator [Gemmatimonadota bacterium]